MSIEKKLFDQMNENSAYWFNKSAELHSSAKVIWNEIDNGDSVGHFDVYKMLEGMAFEAMAKAFTVAKKQKLQTNHQLTTLFSEAGFKLTKNENKILEVLTSYIEWAGKYPTPKANKGAKALKDHWDIENNLVCSLVHSELHSLWRKFSDKYMAEYNV